MRLRVVGAMSGTSLDGVDAAVLETDGEAILGLGRSAYRPYAEAERAILRAALGTWPGDPAAEAAARVVEDAHADLLADLKGDALAVHGQTLAHDPGGRGTHQALDGAALATRLDRPVVWDFRSADVSLGGEGAPLAPAYHHACVRHAGIAEPVAILNLGGVGNLTWIDPARDVADAGALLAFDTGPANAPIDDLAQDWLGEPYDRDGWLAREGEADEALAAAILRHPYFFRVPPKSLDRDAWRERGADIDDLPPSHAAATWVRVIALSVAHGLSQCPAMPARVLVAGGGRRNPAIMDALRAACPCAVDPIESVGLDGDMLEAQAFAFLAVRVLRGLPTSFPGTTGVAAPVAGGIVSDPQGALDTVRARARHNARHGRGRGVSRGASGTR
ncbi:anhydro-N-acetylmuramic acid kinase [Jannaschia sp. Os4]|uniref:anhydro-N-acetylmuramic acid kinase n=1 Tax=Jannaschia sp. Os4 TaxID=2807617 RepID=UPI00193A595A|nr:anhydro-N-acetylmuramic acid kinase [Jannaschia sp. Os4]MBM2576560.1 anhydro-N-acetylmuramic acid kinase [Jannaschia sp. Os4]